ncbi:DUF2637 domain-containing protein [Streptomyces sp. NPDC001073]
MVIAGIGFAGSYAAVRELALKKGFGNLAYVFPIGIDAGICVLLALDLLLTWIRIPFPLLRQTAWLLTVATIAFNGAAAWPDPLDVGMHAVIPILFVVSVEAARHAIGRIADITADKHMEGVRLTRWLLSPIPTFLLWRRMKLWELRSYEQVIKLEQDRLVYQARLHSRFGRAWRRKAPVESMMPLRLARYGIPLPQSSPTDIEAGPPTPQSEVIPPNSTAPVDPTPDRSVTQATPTEATALRGEQVPRPENEGNTSPQQLQHVQQSRPDTSSRSAGTRQMAAHDRCYSPEGKNTLTEDAHEREEREQKQHRKQEQMHDEPTVVHTGLDETVFAAVLSRAAAEPHQPEHSLPVDALSQSRHMQHPASGKEPEPNAPVPPTGLTHSQPTSGNETAPPWHSLTPVDRYYLAWRNLHKQLHKEPDATQLSAYLATQGILDRNNQSLRPKTLARYFLQFRIYTIWAQHRALDDQPAPGHVAKELAQHGITAQYNQPIRPHDLEQHSAAFERRWQALHHQKMF